MKFKTHIILWLALIALIFGWMKTSQVMDKSVVKPTREVVANSPLPPSARAQEDDKEKAKNATFELGRVVTLDTTRGKIEFVLFEKDCPKSAKRIAEMVEAGAYDGVKFPRVENWVIQVDQPKKEVAPMGCEFAHGLSNVAGAVGMARKNDRNSNTSIFYIVKISQTSLDYDYTVFGHIIKGMDVVNQMQLNDVIKRATLRPSTDADAQLLKRALKVTTPISS